MTKLTASRCGNTKLEATGTPIVSAVCYCESCRRAGHQFEQASGAPAVVNADGGVEYSIFRKDRVRIAKGGEHLEIHRLTDNSPTRRVVATCCNAPMFVDFTKGHWLTLYRDRISDRPPLEVGVMAKDLPGKARPNNLPTYETQSPKVMVKLLLSWAAMGFQRPKVDW